MQALKRQHLTRETVRRHLQKQAVGTVLVSGWNDSYGNQVLLDNGAGLSTRYAQMTQTAVTTGKAVTAGQVIGYVGSTGDSTGNHLHFGVMQGGVRVNPLDMLSPTNIRKCRHPEQLSQSSFTHEFQKKER